MKISAIFLVLAANCASADIVVPNRTLPAHTIIQPADVIAKTGDISGAVSDVNAVVGRETKRALYAGRPIALADIGEPAIIDRNGLLKLVYRTSGLRIETDGRSLDRGSAGDLVRVMNLGSRNTVTARIGEDGHAYVDP